MSKRWFTSDWHLGSSTICDYCNRPFANVKEMNKTIIENCNSIVGKDDIIIHLGDFCCYGSERGYTGLKIHPNEYIRQINGTFVNLLGNHDITNKTKSIGTSLRMSLGKLFVDVSCSHYPSYDKRAYGSFQVGDIHLHGHCHNGKIFTIDKQNKVLNVNVCCDLWNFMPISEQHLIEMIHNFISKQNVKLI